MKSAAFEYGPYTIKTFASSGMVRARLFRNGVWVREISDWTADTVEEAVRLMKRTVEEAEEEAQEGQAVH
ncbi:hypothetical protein CR162_07605 [Pseudoroseomonas rhizosphaerae]|uniref:Uncharacterized protein n=1 Tax=Teichococcus rhizosphaerae TaxID=1335062 RepID=A0A2C6Y4G8_9PROT|nr:hypothetical protein [Pseudoroseomonas rhizosphaerae]PHK95702.1 hypothetical protein CR162_07605 [Pseudoroseomonas rhizosphaerae]